MRGAPFSADAITTVHHTLRDGTRIDRTAIARYYRDGAGRVRVEQTIAGGQTGATREQQTRITIATTANDGGVYIIDPLAATVSRADRRIASVTLGGGRDFALPLGRGQFLIFRRPERAKEHRDSMGTAAVKEESLGVRRIAGVDTIGRQVTIAVGQGEHDRPVDVLDERWESPELEIVVYARSIDPRAGILEYRLENIQRTEPDPSVFVIPDAYTQGFSTDTAQTSLWFADNITPKAGERGEEVVRQQGFPKALR